MATFLICSIFVTCILHISTALRVQSPDPFPPPPISFPENTTIDSPLLEIKYTDEKGEVKVSSLTCVEVNVELVQDEKTVHLKLGQTVSTQNAESMVIMCSGSLSDGSGKIDYSIIFTVKDVNDHPPVFSTTVNTFEWPENTDSGIFLFNVSAADHKDALNYGTDGIIFEIRVKIYDDIDVFSLTQNKIADEQVASIELVKSLDYEKQAVYYMDIIAYDNHKTTGDTQSAQISVIISVIDVDDNEPDFMTVPSITRIPEDTAQDTIIFEVKAVDRDRNINNNIEYELNVVNYDEKKLFEIDKLSGEVKVNSQLDRESLEQGDMGYTLTITAFEVSILRRNTSINTTVLIEDVNDCPPKFQMQNYVGNIGENSLLNTVVTLTNNSFIFVKDDDQGENAVFNFVVQKPYDFLAMNPSGGRGEGNFTLRVVDNTHLDYETAEQNPFTIEIQAIDANNPTLSDKAYVTIDLLDENDQFPQFSQSSYTAEIFENASIGSNVITVSAQDNDTLYYGTLGIYYSLILQNKNLFHINKFSGKVSTNSDFNREKLDEYVLTVEARDNNGTGNSNQTEIHVTILDVNDEYPEFSQPGYSSNLYEGKDAFEFTELKIEATDKDIGKNAEIVYSIFTSGDSQYFNSEITADYIKIKPKASLDYETICPHIPERCPLSLTVKAEDQGDPPLFSEVNVTIMFIDVNDETPKFNPNQYNANLDETVEGGRVVTTVTATDKDVTENFKAIDYQITHGSSYLFSIDSSTGIITVMDEASLDLGLKSNKRMYNLTVVARDGMKSHDDTCYVIITINDVNNKPPKFQIASQEVNISEWAPPDTELDCTNDATDEDDDADLEFSIDWKSTKAYFSDSYRETLIKDESEYNSMFKIDQMTGKVSVNSTLDRESISKFELVLVVTDVNQTIGIKTSSASLTVVIDDENDNYPVFKLKEYKGTVEENSLNGTEILPIVSATDADLNQKITFSLVPHKIFTSLVDITTTGILYVIGDIDREVLPNFTVTVMAKDDGNPPLNSTISFNVAVKDVNDNPPEFQLNETLIEIPEDFYVQCVITTVMAVDVDEIDQGKITYSLSNGYPDFVINKTSGSITVNRELDCDKEPPPLFVDIGLIAFDTGSMTTANITVHITDVNDNSPCIKAAGVPESDNSPCIQDAIEPCKNILETLKINEPVMKISAEDPDQGENGKVTFYFVKKDDGRDYINDMFFIQPINDSDKSVTIFVKEELHSLVKSAISEYSIGLNATDNGIVPTPDGTKTFQICIEDVNEKPQILWPKDGEIIWVDEGKPMELDKLCIKATDPDKKLEFRQLEYSLKNSYGTFSILSDGCITLSGAYLNREDKRTYEMTVIVKDKAGLQETCSFIIRVKNINDNLPVFDNPELSLQFFEEYPPGTEMRYISEASDKDYDQIDDDEDDVKISICYYIVDGNSDEMFLLNKTSRELTTNKILDYETKKKYAIRIFVANNCDLDDPTKVSMEEDKRKSRMDVVISVIDVNDNLPTFIEPSFGGGIDNSISPGSEVVMKLEATDKDENENAIMVFSMGKVMLHQKGEGPVDRTSYLKLDPKTGEITTRQQFNQNLQGFLELTVTVKNTISVVGKDKDKPPNSAIVKLYLLNENQKMKFVIKKSVEAFDKDRIKFIEQLQKLITNIYAVHINRVRAHVDASNAVDNRLCDVFVHFVDNDNTVVSPDEIQKILDDSSGDELLAWKNDFGVVESSLGGQKSGKEDNWFNDVTNILIYVSLALVSLVTILLLAIYCAKVSRLKRELRVATMPTYSSDTKEKFDAECEELKLPNTNRHIGDGSNPIYNLEFEPFDETCDDDDTASLRSAGSVGNTQDFEGGFNNGGFAAQLETMFPIQEDSEMPKKLNLTEDGVKINPLHNLSEYDL